MLNASFLNAKAGVRMPNAGIFNFRFHKIHVAFITPNIGVWIAKIGI